MRRSWVIVDAAQGNALISCHRDCSCPCAALFCPAYAMCTPLRSNVPLAACVCCSSAAEVPPIHPFVDIEHRLRLNDCFPRRHNSLRSAATPRHSQTGPIHSARQPLANAAACALSVTVRNGRQPQQPTVASAAFCSFDDFPFEWCGLSSLLDESIHSLRLRIKIKAGLNLAPPA